MTEDLLAKIVSYLREGIIRGDFPVRGPLPRAYELTQKFEASSTTVSSAFGVLAQEGLITKARGAARRIVLCRPEPETEPVAGPPVGEPAGTGRPAPASGASQPVDSALVALEIGLPYAVVAMVRLLAQFEGATESDVVRLAVETFLESRKLDPAFQLRLRGLIGDLQRFWAPEVEFSPSP